MAKSESVTAEQRENLFIEKHAVQFLLRLKATMPELDENICTAITDDRAALHVWQERKHTRDGRRGRISRLRKKN